MASEVDSWSDLQIREKFEELGHPVGPVTATTRKIYVKRLKVLMGAGGSSLVRREVENDEEVDDEPDVAPITRIPRRLPRSALAALNQTMKNDNNSSHVSAENSSLRRSSGNISEQSTPEREVNHSELFNNRGRHSSLEQINSRSPARRSERSPGRSPARTSTMVTRKSFNREAEARKSIGRESELTPTRSESDSPKPARKLTPGRKSVARNEQSTSSPAAATASRTCYGINGLDNDSFGYELSSSADEVMARIRKSIRDGENLNLANKSFRSYASNSQELNSKIPSSSWRSTPVDDECMVSDDEDSITSPVKIFRSQKQSEYEVHTLDSSKNSWSPVLFVVITPLLAIIVYLVVSSPAKSTMSTSGLVYPACRGQISDIPGASCLDTSDKHLLESMLHAFDRGLDEIRAKIPCSTSVSNPILIDNNSVKDLITSSDGRLGFRLVDQKLADLKLFIKTNPHLDFKATSSGLNIIQGPRTMMCSLQAAIILIADWIIKICAAIFIAVSLYFGLHWHLSKQQKLQEEIFNAVDKVIGFVKTRRIVPLATMENELHSAGYSAEVTEAAISQAMNDSRISLDKLSNTSALRWTGGVAESFTVDNLWDSSDKEEIPFFIPPTSCLKIRGMFDRSQLKGDHNVKQIVNAVLEEAVGNRIVHVVVNRGSVDGVVYLRCLSKPDAGGVFRRLHGGKFDGRRVTVKFLKEEQYERKFPESVNYSLPLRPSVRAD